MSLPKLNLLVVTDLHYTKEACPLARRRGELGRVLLRKTLLRLKHAGLKADVLVLLGDLVDNGLAPGAAGSLAEIAEEAKKSGLPILAVPGNHDAGAGFDASFPESAGFREIGGYGFLVFHDEIGEGDVTRRRAADLALPGRVAAERPGLPLIALQHNPLHPAIDSSYPYMPVNADDILRGYEKAGVLLSLSGHYHAGQPLHRLESGLACHTVPALCEEPFRFSFIRLDGRSIRVDEHSLKLEAPGLADVHCHTQYAYCGTTVGAEEDAAISRAMGLGRLCLTEHAFQLYFDKEAAWSFRWQTDAAMAAEALASRRGRMDDYKRFIRPRRSEFVRLGLEVDLCSDGRLLLAPEDAAGWDVVVGAVHAIGGSQQKGITQDRAEGLFKDDTERLLAQPIHVLAHPFRFFRRAGLAEPVHLYGWMADRLARAGVAAEINFHTNENEAGFFRACADRGVRIALGSDSHDLAEVGEFYPHLEVLKRAGIAPEQFAAALFFPG
jgi:histidinol phosphatase-like PHP family hydrolase